MCKDVDGQFAEKKLKCLVNLRGSASLLNNTRYNLNQARAILHLRWSEVWCLSKSWGREHSQGIRESGLDLTLTRGSFDPKNIATDRTNTASPCLPPLCGSLFVNLCVLFSCQSVSQNCAQRSCELRKEINPSYQLLIQFTVTVTDRNEQKKSNLTEVKIAHGKCLY